MPMALALIYCKDLGCTHAAETRTTREEGGTKEEGMRGRGETTLNPCKEPAQILTEQMGELGPFRPSARPAELPAWDAPSAEGGPWRAQCLRKRLLPWIPTDALWS